ncbi:MAG: response regulator transcription factor [Methanocella sp.]
MALKWDGGVAVVEDEKALNDLLVMMLKLKGIPVSFTAYDGPEAVQKYRDGNPKPEIVIMDYRLPTSTGVEAMKEMLKTDGKARFIFLSADSSAKDEAILAGAVMFIMKPASMHEVINAVEKVAADDPGGCDVPVESLRS